MSGLMWAWDGTDYSAKAGGQTYWIQPVIGGDGFYWFLSMEYDGPEDDENPFPKFKECASIEDGKKQCEAHWAARLAEDARNQGGGDGG